MRWQVTFTQNHVYEVETDSCIHSYDDYLKLKEDAFDKAYKEFYADMHYPVAHCSYDDYEIEELDEWGEEDDEE